MLQGDGMSPMQQPVVEALKTIERPVRIDRDAVEAAMREAYPPEELAEHIDLDILAYGYERDFMIGDGPYDWWCEARLMVLRFMREAFERGSVALLCDLEPMRERATVQQLLADRDLERRWVAPRREANRPA